MGKKRDRHAEMVGLLQQILDELRAQQSKQPQSPWPPQQPLVPQPSVAYMAPGPCAPAVVMYMVGGPLDWTGDGITWTVSAVTTRKP